MGTHNVVVVGVDGSKPSLAALRYALAEADRRGAALRVVCAYEPPDQWMAYGIAPLIDADKLHEQVLAEANQAVREATEGAAHPPRTEVTAIPDAPARALVRMAENADLLVVGNRGQGRFTSALLGSVSLACVFHASCPVAVVRPTLDSAEALAESAGAPV